jgi:hypothetical protein
VSLRVVIVAGFEDLQNDPGAVLESLTMEAGPPIGFGAFAGFASGFALKKAGKVAAVVRVMCACSTVGRRPRAREARGSSPEALCVRALCVCSC